MQIWVKRDRRREYGIKNIALSFTEEEETRLIVDKYSKIDISLSEFGLPDTFLWIEKVDKVKTVEVDNTNKLIAEIKKGKLYWYYYLFRVRNLCAGVFVLTAILYFGVFCMNFDYSPVRWLYRVEILFF